MYHFNLSSLEEVHSIFVKAVGGAVHDAGNAGVDQDLGAIDARQVSDVAGCAFCRYAVQSRLNDGVRFRVDRADAVTIDHRGDRSHHSAVAGWRAVEAGREDAFFPIPAHSRRRHGRRCFVLKLQRRSS